MNNLNDNLPGYIAQLLKQNGVSVVTVSDGWVFNFTKQKLLSLLESVAEAEIITIFVKSSANTISN
jgi:hypothetical protein